MPLPANKFRNTRWSFLNDWLVHAYEGFVKRRTWLLVGFSFLLLTTLGAVLSIPVRNHLERKRREAAYEAAEQAAIQPYQQAFKPGTTRREVESYLRGKNIIFFQTGTGEDLAKIGSEEVPWCGEVDVYVAFQFAGQRRSDGSPETDDLDRLNDVSIHRQAEGCL